MSRASYVPDRCDLVWLPFDPTIGREQSGTRPALVLSPASYNERVGLALVCPVTSKAKGYPFEVSVRAGRIGGVALADQVRSVDWRLRRAKLAARADNIAVQSALSKARLLL